MNNTVYAFPSGQKALVDQMDREVLDHLDNLCLLMREQSDKIELLHANEIAETLEKMKKLLVFSSPYSDEGKEIREGIRKSLRELKRYVTGLRELSLGGAI